MGSRGRTHLLVLIAAGALACAPAAGPTVTRTPDEPIEGSDPAATPEDDGDRARSVLTELEAYCAPRNDACGATERPDVYPNAEVSEADRRFVDDRREELRTLGFRVRWDPGTERFELVRGNVPIRGGDLRDDP